MIEFDPRDDDRDDDWRPGAGTATVEGYRWECPICSKSRVNRLSEQGRNALRALKTHLYLTDGSGHGETGSFPEDVSEDELRRYVEPVEGQKG